MTSERYLEEPPLTDLPTCTTADDDCLRDVEAAALVPIALGGLLYGWWVPSGRDRVDLATRPEDVLAEAWPTLIGCKKSETCVLRRL